MSTQSVCGTIAELSVHRKVIREIKRFSLEEHRKRGGVYIKGYLAVPINECSARVHENRNKWHGSMKA